MDGTNAIIRLPSELWSRIFRICVFELDNDLPPARHLHGFRPIKPVLRNDSAIALACVCSYWKNLVMSDHRLAVIRIYREDFSEPESLALHPDSTVGGADQRIAIQISVDNRGGSLEPPDVGRIQRLLNHFAARIETLSLALSTVKDAESVFKALEDNDFKQLNLLEIFLHCYGIFRIPNTRIRAPQITTLKLLKVKIFRVSFSESTSVDQLHEAIQNDDLKFQRFFQFVGGLPRLQHLTLIMYSEDAYDTQQDRVLADNTRTELTALKTLNLEDYSDSIIALLRYLILPSINDLTLSFLEYERTLPEWCYHSPGFDFPELSRLNLSGLNLCAERLMRFAHLPALSHLIFRSSSFCGRYHRYHSLYPQLSSLEISIPNLRHLSIGLLLAKGQCPLTDFSSRICTGLLTSLCLTPFAIPWPLSDEPINLDPDAFSSVRTLIIYIESTMIKTFDGSHFDSICASLSGVVHLQVCFQLADVIDARRMRFLCPNGLLDDVDSGSQMQLMPNLEKLSLLAQVKAWSRVVDWRISGHNCSDVKKFVRERSSIGSRLQSIVFNRLVTPKTLSYIQQHVDHVSVDRNAWKGICAIIGESTTSPIVGRCITSCVDNLPRKCPNPYDIDIVRYVFDWVQRISYLD